MNYLMRQVKGLVCALVVVGALPASADVGGGMCQFQAGPIFYHPQGPLLWGSRPTWDSSEVAPGKSVLVSVDLGEAAAEMREEDGRLVGKKFIGSIFPGQDAAGQPVHMVICGVDSSEEDPDTAWHWIEVWNPLAETWENPCVATEEVRYPRAVILTGTWDATGAHHPDSQKVTFACETGALGKCVSWGYKPWASGKEGQSLASVHQACTRMARADYCGDGTSHTVEGVQIDHYDSVGVAERLPPPTGEPWRLAFEAAWLPDGAACVTRTREGQDPLTLLTAQCPGRFKYIPTYIDSEDHCTYVWTSPETSVLRNRIKTSY